MPGLATQRHSIVNAENQIVTGSSQTDTKAKKLIGKIQAQLKSNTRLINDYGKRFNYGDWTNGDFTTTDGVKFKAMSIGQSPRGESEEENRPDYILMDDADTRKRVKNNRMG